VLSRRFKYSVLASSVTLVLVLAAFMYEFLMTDHVWMFVPLFICACICGGFIIYGDYKQRKAREG